MVSKEKILELLQATFLSRILLFAEASLPESQFRAYRKLVLDEFWKGKLGEALDGMLKGNGNKGW